jgi:hypothetical protein
MATYRTALNSQVAARLVRVFGGGWVQGKGRAHCFSNEQYFCSTPNAYLASRKGRKGSVQQTPVVAQVIIEDLFKM